MTKIRAQMPFTATLRSVVLEQDRCVRIHFSSSENGRNRGYLEHCTLVRITRFLPFCDFHKPTFFKQFPNFSCERSSVCTSLPAFTMLHVQQPASPPLTPHTMRHRNMSPVHALREYALSIVYTFNFQNADAFPQSIEFHNLNDSDANAMFHPSTKQFSK